MNKTCVNTTDNRLKLSVFITALAQMGLVTPYFSFYSLSHIPISWGLLLLKIGGNLILAFIYSYWILIPRVLRFRRERHLHAADIGAAIGGLLLLGLYQAAVYIHTVLTYFK